MIKKFRLYIDESGTHNYSVSNDIDQRYLGLMGLIIDDEANVKVLQPGLLGLKRLIADDPDELPILHREDIINKRGAFGKLNDEAIKKEFNERFISLLKEMDYIICTVVLDKKSHYERYQKAALHPYHYCLDVLLERYTFCLEEHEGQGDVIAEARGKREDTALKAKYKEFYLGGTYFRHPYHIQKSLTSRELKVKPKTAMIAGLEFADLLSLAAKLDTLYSYEKISTLKDNFCKIVIDNTQDKYRRSPTGNPKGFGKKLIS